MVQRTNQQENQKYLEINKNGNTAYQTYEMQQSSKGKFIVINFYLRKKKDLINNLILHFKQLEK